MNIEGHILVSAAVSGVLQLSLGSWPLTVSSFLTGVFLDLDHFLDYFVQYGRRLDLKEFFGSFSAGRYRKIIIFLHGWEWAPVLAAAVWITDAHPLSLGIAVGFLHHMALDQLTNAPRPWGYFVLWRLRRRFAARTAFDKFDRPSESSSIR